MPAIKTANTFRLFISSTFSDFSAEREALQQRVFPELEKFCAERGARFQAVDLRWGITEEAQQEHDTLRICLEEVRRCQELSPRPNFAVLLGDRYGWEPVPARIPSSHWERLKTAADAVSWKVIKVQYQLDKNAVPPVYCLRKREGNWALDLKREAELLQALRRAARDFEGDDQLPYFASATHQEIALGALATQDEEGQNLHPEEHVQVYVRNIEGLPSDASGRAFVDWDANSQAPVPGAQERLSALKTRLRRQLPGRVQDIQARWVRGGTDESHIDAFCAQFLADQKTTIERELGNRYWLQDDEVRYAQHHAFANERARNFVGRTGVLKTINAYITHQGQTSPLIVHGDGGSGKSALMAKAYQNALNGVAGPTVLLARFIGGVPGTELLMTLLSELIADIQTAYGRPATQPPENLKMAREAFEVALQGASAERPLVLFLDAIDQLDRADGAWLLEWLPRVLGEYTRVVASIRSGQTLLQAQRRYPDALLEVPPMTLTEGKQMLDAWLADTREAHYNAGIAPVRGRRLTHGQCDLILKTFENSGKPLWLKLAYEVARNWTSTDIPTHLPETVEAMVQDLITRRLSEGEKHPRAFATRALAYLTAGRFGLAEEELDYALATDLEVKTELDAQNAKTGQAWGFDAKRPRLPPILWSRLYFDLQPYLATAQVDGTIVYRWFHREFKEEIAKKYLIENRGKEATHRSLADTFFALAPYAEDLFKYTDACGAQQPAALRRVMEQPWQLAQAGQHDVLINLLTDFGFCMGKCAARRGGDLIRDVVDSSVLTHAPVHPQIWIEFLLSIGHLLRSASQAWLPHRVLLQLALEETTLKDRCVIESWAQRYANWKVVRTLQNVTSGCEKYPMVTFDGHKDKVSGVHLLPGNRVLSWCSNDQEIRIWDVFSGETLAVFHHENQINSVELMSDGRVLSSSNDQKLNVWSIDSHERMASFRVWEPIPQGVGGFRSIDDARFAHWSAGREPWDYRIRIRSLQSGALIATLPRSKTGDGHTDFVIGVLPLEGDSFLSWSHDQTVRLWHIASGECRAASADLQAPIVKVELSVDGPIQVYTLSDMFQFKQVLWVLCPETLAPFQDARDHAALAMPENRLAIELGTSTCEISWKGERITLHRADQITTDGLCVVDGKVAPQLGATVLPTPKLTKLKVLTDTKILAGLGDASLALVDAETGVTIDRLEGRADCAGSGCLMDQDLLAIWTGEAVGKNLLRVWLPGGRRRVDKQHVPHGRILGAEPVPGGLLTWGKGSVIRWNVAPLGIAERLDHPANILFVRRLDADGNFLSCDSNGNIGLWHEHSLGRVKWVHTNRRGLDDVCLHGDDRILVLYRESGRQFIEGFTVSCGSSLGVTQRGLGKRLFNGKTTSKQGFPRLKIHRESIEWQADCGDVVFWINRGGPLEIHGLTPQGTLIARRAGELLLIQTDMRERDIGAGYVVEDQQAERITEAELANLRLYPRLVPRVSPSEKTSKSWPDVFATLRLLASNENLAKLDSPDFSGSTWSGGGVRVFSAHSPRAQQDVRAYRNMSWAHSDRFCMITRFPKAIDWLLKTMRSEVMPRLFMDKDRFYVEVAMSMAAAEAFGEGLLGILLAGIDKAQELVRESGLTWDE
jgi:hypothetical protein